MGRIAGYFSKFSSKHNKVKIPMAISDPNIVSKITNTSNAYGVPADVALAVANTESGGNQDAISNKGAIGIFQLMPSTASWLGVDPTNLDDNIKGGVSYLAKLYKQFGDWTLAIAAYNAGPGNVDKYGGVPPFSETQDYVTKVLGQLGSTVVNSGSTEQTGYSDIDVSIGVGVVSAFVLAIVALVRS